MSEVYLWCGGDNDIGERAADNAESRENVDTTRGSCCVNIYIYIYDLLLDLPGPSAI